MCLIGFSSIRSLVADAHSSEGDPYYDPVSLILLDLITRILEYTMKRFSEILQDKFQAAPCRYYAGVNGYCILCEPDFSQPESKDGRAASQ